MTDSQPTGPLGPEDDAAARARDTERLLAMERQTFEKLMFATLAEQRTARRWKMFKSIAWLLFFIFVAWALTHRGGTSNDKSLPHTAVIEIKGEIASGA